MLTRFAPSPTGYLHIGNVRTALLCYLYAKKEGGKFMLRLDDTDLERSTEEFAEGIKQDLEWLGINWDLTAKQSERMDSYKKAVEKLKADGRIYACYETAEELDIKRKMQRSRGKPPIYDREGLSLSDEQKAKFEEEGRKPHYRFLLEEKEISWVDEIRGEVHFPANHASDPIIIRESGDYTYMLPSTVDDIDFEVTHVLRGEDHVNNTAIQIQIFEALGGKIPTFIHNSLIKTKDGKLSKRTGSASLKDMREDLIEPMAINSFLAKVGTSDSIELRGSLEELINEFDIKKFNKSPTIYAIEDIERLNTKLLHEMDFAEAKERLEIEVDEDFWLAVRPNISSLKEVSDWWEICKEKIDPVIEDKDFAAEASELLPDGNWDENTWNDWIEKVKEKTGRKGKELFMPVRKALTGMEHGPELKVLLPLIGRERAIARLKGEAA